MINKFTVLLFSLLLSFNLMNAQECFTKTNIANQNFVPTTRKAFAAVNQEVCINMYFHIVRETDGTGGLNPTEIPSVIDSFNEVFNPVNIKVRSIGHSYIDNSDSYNLVYDTTADEVIGFDDLIQTYSVPNAINYFLVENIEYEFEENWIVSIAGVAEGVLSKNFITGFGFAQSTISAHELGHCLNLYHTHHGTYNELGGDPNQCPENIDGSNCTTCGDYVCDTPADPGLHSNYIINGTEIIPPNYDFLCNYVGDDGYNPDVRNLMASGCREYFSAGQGERMRNAINNSSLLQPIINNSSSCENLEPYISGEKVVCYNDDTIITIENADPPYTWSVSSNMTITSATNQNSITVVANSSGFSGYGIVTITHASGTSQFNVWIGKPRAPTYLNGPSEVNSGSWYSYTGGGAVGSESYEWRLPYPFEVTNVVDQTSDYWQMLPEDTGYNYHVWTGNGEINGKVQLIAVNKCGNGGSINIDVIHDNGTLCTTCDLWDPNPYPNQASNQFILDFSKHPENQTFSVKVLDIHSNMIISEEFENELKVFNVQNIPNGIYFLHINDGNKIRTKQLIIKH